MIEWHKRNRERVNLKRKELRAKKRLALFADKRCLLCEFPLTSKFAGCNKARLYCNDCTARNPMGVRRHKWRRYYNKKMMGRQTEDKTSMAFYRKRLAESESHRTIKPYNYNPNPNFEFRDMKKKLELQNTPTVV